MSDKQNEAVANERCDSLYFLEEAMQEIFFIFAKTVSIVIDVVSIAMLVQVILQFFVDTTQNRIYILACFITEPFIAPVRLIMARLNILQDSPIDWAFFVTSVLLALIGSILPPI